MLDFGASTSVSAAEGAVIAGSILTSSQSRAWAIDVGETKTIHYLSLAILPVALLLSTRLPFVGKADLSDARVSMYLPIQLD